MNQLQYENLGYITDTLDAFKGIKIKGIMPDVQLQDEHETDIDDPTTFNITLIYSTEELKDPTNKKYDIIKHPKLPKIFDNIIEPIGDEFDTDALRMAIDFGEYMNIDLYIKKDKIGQKYPFA